jgi:hypothetical protein
MAALLAGQSLGEVSRQYRIPEGTLHEWRRQLHGVQTLKDDGAEFGVLIAEYLRENLTTLAAQAKHFRDATWLSNQPANEAAVLHGVLTDKAIRLLEALTLEPADDGADQPA